MPPAPQTAAPGLSYVEIGVADPERALDFYRGLLGLHPAAEPPELPAAGTHWLDGGGGGLVKLVQAPAGSTLGGWHGDDLQRGLRHVGLKVGDVDRQAERLRAGGVTFTVPPTDAVGGVRLAFFRDPDGTLLEIVDGHVRYHTTHDPALAERERARAAARPADAGPVLDHAALTCADLAATLDHYGAGLGYRRIGRLVHERDPRGFTIDYLQAGPAVLEVFSFTAPTTPAPDAPAEERLGLRALGLAAAEPPGGEAPPGDPDGVRLRPVAAR